MSDQTKEWISVVVGVIVALGILAFVAWVPVGGHQ